jgi:protein gp37
VFVNSMSDLFHKDVPYEFVASVFNVMARCPQHTFQVLTKRPKRMKQIVAAYYHAAGQNTSRPIRPLPNVWLGTSIGLPKYAWRADHLRATPAAVRFISAEPLLGPVAYDLNLAEIDWLIAGGESGDGHRPCDPNWVRDLRDDCQLCEIPFFFKQWEGRTPKSGGRELDGRTWDEMPRVAR